MSYWAMSRFRSGIMEWYIHHGPRDALDDVPLYILKAAKDASGPSKPIKRRLHFYSLAWIKAGACWYWSELQTRSVRVKVGQIIAVPPGLVHAYAGRGKPFREDFVVFCGPTANALAKLGIFDPLRPFITLREPERIGEIAERVSSESLEAHLKAGLLLEQILIDARFDTAHQASPYYPVIQDLLMRIAQTPEEHLSHKQMADLCGVSESHFRKLFREEVGIAPSRYCERSRMDRACKLLAESNQRVFDVAAALGYEDPLYFSKRFRATIGMSPRAYRRSVRG